MATEKTAVKNLSPAGLQIDGSARPESQIRVLNMMFAEEDLTFVEGSVKDVTDRGRAMATQKMQRALELAIGESSLVETPPKVGAFKGPEASEVRHEVRKLLRVLQSCRAGKEGQGEERDELALQVVRQLEELPVDVACLKATKVAAELNHQDFRSDSVFPREVRERTAALVKRWRVMYKGVEVAAGRRRPDASESRKAKHTATDLEEAAYTLAQRLSQYCEAVDATVERCSRDAAATKQVLQGELLAKEFVKHALKWHQRQRDLKSRSLG